MDILTWQSEYESGNAEIDQQHQQLLHLLQSLVLSVTTDSEPETLRLLVEKLKLETLDHFQHEEKIMGANNYPGYLCHRAAHDNLEREVKSFWAACAVDLNYLTLDRLAALSGLLLHHICQEDLPMLQCLDSPQLVSCFEEELTSANLF